MHRGMLADYFEGVAVKRLSAVEADPERSHQHEFAGGHIRKLMGDADRTEIPARFIWLNDEQEGVSEDGTVTWYDSRIKQPHRAAEYRLYYYNNSVTKLMKEGDSFFIAVRSDGTLMIIVTSKDSTIQNQLVWLFGLDESPSLEFKTREFSKDEDSKLDFAARYILDELGIDAEEPESAKLDGILEKLDFRFPGTREFSALARESLSQISPLGNPDSVLMAWIEREELLFHRLERYVVADRLRAGFLLGEGPDVDGFIAFSLSVQNRRKSRAGRSLENHLEVLFKARNILFDRGAETENHNKPDFLFPGGAQYHDPAFPSERITLLGAKSTCKDRWRQVLSEGSRIDDKHLLTLEPRISENQTSEMRSKRLQLVVPSCLHESYRATQRAWLMDVSSFTDLVIERQKRDMS